MEFVSTYVGVDVAAHGSPNRDEAIESLADTRAIFSVIPRPMLDCLGVTHIDRQLIRAFGEQVMEREMGRVILNYDNSEGTVSVTLAEESIQPILGVTALGFVVLRVDPGFRRLNRTNILMLPLTRL